MANAEEALDNRHPQEESAVNEICLSANFSGTGRLEPR